jgi:hypothetical protein
VNAFEKRKIPAVPGVEPLTVRHTVWSP